MFLILFFQRSLKRHFPQHQKPHMLGTRYPDRGPQTKVCGPILYLKQSTFEISQIYIFVQNVIISVLKLFFVSFIVQLAQIFLIVTFRETNQIRPVLLKNIYKISDTADSENSLGFISKCIFCCRDYHIQTSADILLPTCNSPHAAAYKFVKIIRKTCII